VLSMTAQGSHGGYGHTLLSGDPGGRGHFAVAGCSRCGLDLRSRACSYAGDAPIERFTPEALDAANERIWKAMAALMPPYLAARAS